jgi:hypothetical protein
MIVPVGTQRIMEAQAPPPMAQPARLDMPEDMDVSQLDGFSDPADEIQQEIDESEQQSEMSGDKSDIRATVFNFLVGLGYPPRRLQEFKSQFVSESGTPSSGAEVTLKVPDEMYGKNMPIPREKMKEIVQEVEQKHGLSFTNYTRQNEELTLKFISQDTADRQSLEDQSPGDILDKVYGKPSGGQKSARTIQELIKSGESKRFFTLKALLGDK